MTFEILKFDKFKEVNNLQLLNILGISSTFDVSNFDKSNEVKLVQEENIKFIDVAFEVSKLSKLISYMFLHAQNILIQLILLLSQYNSTLLSVLLK